jgi:hypothetical protein
MKEPNFFIVGAAKAGTTSMYKYLGSHPDIYFSPIKEPQYYAFDIRDNNFDERTKQSYLFDMKQYLSKDFLEEKHIALLIDKSQYLELFQNVTSEKVVGEISNVYLFSKVAAKEIYNDNPESVIYIILRNPVERAFSHWLMDLRGGIEKEYDFVKAIKKDYQNNDRCWGNGHLYIDVGLYYEQVKRYIDIFPKNQIKIFLFDEIEKDSTKVLKSMLDFLNLDQIIKINNTKRYNKAELPRFPFLYNSLRKLTPFFNNVLGLKIKIKLRSLIMSNKNLPRLTMRDRERVFTYFKKDIEKLEKLIDEDLSTWKV